LSQEPTSLRWYRVENAASPEAAELHIYDEISHWGILADDFRRELDAVSSPRIRLHLNSPGGYVDDGVAIFNIIKDHPASVDVFVEGIAASIASVIAMAGDRIVIAPHARMMIHNARMLVDGDDAAFLEHAARLADSNRNIASIYAERAGGELDHWLGLMKDTTWFTDQEAVDAGLADEVGRSNDDAKSSAMAARQIASFDLSRFRDGNRMVARLVTELVYGDVLPDDELPPEAPADEEPVEPAPAEEPTSQLDPITARARAVDAILEENHV